MRVAHPLHAQVLPAGVCWIEIASCTHRAARKVSSHPGACRRRPPGVQESPISGAIPPKRTNVRRFSSSCPSVRHHFDCWRRREDEDVILRPWRVTFPSCSIVIVCLMWSVFSPRRKSSFSCMSRKMSDLRTRSAFPSTEEARFPDSPSMKKSSPIETSFSRISVLCFLAFATLRAAFRTVSYPPPHPRLPAPARSFAGHHRLRLLREVAVRCSAHVHGDGKERAGKPPRPLAGVVPRSPPRPRPGPPAAPSRARTCRAGSLSSPRRRSCR
jgi:hypothetical protein